VIKNFFKVAVRNLVRNKFFSIINICGLAVGMASAILILLWIQNELSYDNFYSKQDRIYQPWNRATFDGKLQCWSTTPKILGPTLKHDYPDVEEVTRVNWGNNFLFSIGDKRITVQGTAVDPGFLKIFDFPLIKGNVQSALAGTYSIVLTEKLATKLFGREESMGKVIKIDNMDNFTVTGVLKDLPNNTRFQDYEYFLPWAYMVKRQWDDSSWGNNSTQTYVLLKPNASASNFENKIKNITIQHSKDEEHIEVFLHPMSKLHLYSKFENGKNTGGKIEVVRLFAVIATLILLIACINFMNLSTARSEKRAKEVGIRKVVGAEKKSLIGQFLGESVLLAFLAGIISIGIVQLSLRGFNELTDKQLYIDYSNYRFWIAGLAFVMFTGIIAGSYPAFFLSSFTPVKVLKGTFKAAHAPVTPRKVLVVIQFTFAIALIICTIIITQQIQYAQDRETGYDRQNLVYHYLVGDIEKNFALIREELLNCGAATSVTKTLAPLTQQWSDSWGYDWKGKDPNAKLDIATFSSDGGLVKTAGLKLLQGRDIDPKTYLTDSTAMILNESAVAIMGFKNPVGETVKYDDINWHVVGVIKDFILQSPYQPMKPMAIHGPKSWFNVIHFKLNPQNPTSKNLKLAEQVFKKFNPEYPFEYHFVDEEYAKKFHDERRTATLAFLFAALTIFISCLGLFGLATYMAENRIKEIGVRKVLGASVITITRLLTKDFLRLVVISLVVAVPIAWLAMHSWLKDYPYHVEIHWWVFLMAGALSLLIALLTVSYQSVRAGLANPVKSLRSE
jgi:ABC-type antimicrobial peptide transport system permease subunit